MKTFAIATTFICFLWVLTSCGGPASLPSDPQSSPTPAPEETPAIDPTPKPTPTLEAPERGKSAPNFQFNDAYGNSVSLVDFRGKAILLNFWATWCVPCRAEMPYIQDVYNTWSEHGLVVLAVNMRESPSKVKQFMQNHMLSFPVLLDTRGSVAEKYNIRYVPTTYFIDSSGVISYIKIGAFRSVAEVEDIVSKILP